MQGSFIIPEESFSVSKRTVFVVGDDFCLGIRLWFGRLGLTRLEDGRFELFWSGVDVTNDPILKNNLLLVELGPSFPTYDMLHSLRKMDFVNKNYCKNMELKSRNNEP